jgi:chromatin assembly factor 1 subunit B
LEINENTEMI